MQDFLKQLLLGVVCAAVPVVTGYGVAFVRKLGENAEATTESTRTRAYIREITDAIADAVAATNQTYVDILKNAGSFGKEAQKIASKKALNACLASISLPAQNFIQTVYGDLTVYLTTRIEAEVRKQKNDAPLLPGTD